MADKTPIEWTDATWTIVQGCDYESPGCKHCYVPGVLWRLMHNPNPAIAAPLAGLIEKKGDTLAFTGKVAMREDRLTWPLHWREPRRIFVPSHGDIFHEAVSDDFLDKIFAVMALCPQHTFQVLTKRPARMRAYVGSMSSRWVLRLSKSINDIGGDAVDAADRPDRPMPQWPLPNVWLGVSVEDQARADERIPLLLETPAAKRFLSCEPLLGPVDLTQIEGGYSALDDGADDGVAPGPVIDWVIAGGESGAEARPMHPDWARSLRDQCQAAVVPFFFKQWGEWCPGENVPPAVSGVRPHAHWFNQTWSFGETDMDDPEDGWMDEPDLYRAGKKHAGRLLDGVEHSAFPGGAA